MEITRLHSVMSIDAGVQTPALDLREMVHSGSVNVVIQKHSELMHLCIHHASIQKQLLSFVATVHAFLASSSTVLFSYLQ